MNVWKMREDQVYEFLARLADSVPVCWELEPDRWRSLVADVAAICRKMQRNGFSAPSSLKTMQNFDKSMTIFVKWSMGLLEVSIGVSSRVRVNVRVETAMYRRDGTISLERFYTDMDGLEALFRTAGGVMEGK